MFRFSIAFMVLAVFILSVACNTPPIANQQNDDLLQTAPKGMPSGSNLTAAEVLHEPKGNQDTYALRKDTFALLSSFFSLGNNHYSEGYADSALYYWQQALQLAEILQDNAYIKALFTNIGAAFMSKGFNHVAAKYFINSDSLFIHQNDSSFNFWINRINIGVAWIEQQKPTQALKVFETVNPPDSLVELRFLKYSNLSNVAYQKNDSVMFLNYLDSAFSYLHFLPHYQNSFLSLALSKLIQTSNLDLLQQYLESFSGRPNEANPYLRVLINYAHLKVHGFFAEPKEVVLDMQKTIEVQENFRAAEAYFYMLAHFYETQNNHKKQVQKLKRAFSFTDSIQLNNNNALLDEYQYLLAQKEIALENEQLLNMTLKQNQKIKNQRFAFVSAIIGMLLLPLLLVLVLRNFKKNMELNKVRVALSKEQLAQEKENKLRLQQNLWAKEQKLDQTLQSMRKIALLKSQFDSFFENLSAPKYKDLSGDLRKVKMNMNAFFSNYQDLAFYANLNEVSLDKLKELEAEFTLLTKREIQVLALLLNDFKTSEVSMLLKRTEKHIENIRVSIRRKLNIPANTSIQDFVNRRYAS